MPALSSTMKEGRVVSWLKDVGDSVEAGEAIMVVESDKADMDVEAFEDGFIAKILVGEGESAPGRESERAGARAKARGERGRARVRERWGERARERESERAREQERECERAREQER